jgi:hypothetical protein
MQENSGQACHQACRPERVPGANAPEKESAEYYLLIKDHVDEEEVNARPQFTA